MDKGTVSKFILQEMRESREQDKEEVVVIKDTGMEESGETDRQPATTDRETFPKHRPRGPSHHRPLARTQSSPLVTLPLHLPPQQSQESQITYKYTTG